MFPHDFQHSKTHKKKTFLNFYRLLYALVNVVNYAVAIDYGECISTHIHLFKTASKFSNSAFFAIQPCLFLSNHGLLRFYKQR